MGGEEPIGEEEGESKEAWRCDAVAVMRERGREAARTAKPPAPVTLETSHASRGWLKALASAKVSCTRQSEMVSKSEAQRVRVRGDGGGEDERRHVRLWV